MVTKERRQGKAGSKWKEEALTFQKVTWACRARLWGPSFQPDPLPCSTPLALSPISNAQIHPCAVPDLDLMAQPAGPSS